MGWWCRWLGWCNDRQVSMTVPESRRVGVGRVGVVLLASDDDVGISLLYVVAARYLSVRPRRSIRDHGAVDDARGQAGVDKCSTAVTTGQIAGLSDRRGAAVVGDTARRTTRQERRVCVAREVDRGT